MKRALRFGPLMQKSFAGGIPYTAHGAQIPPLFLFLFLFLFYVRLGKVRVKLDPQGYERGLVRALQGQSPPQGLEFEEEKSKIGKGGGGFVLQEQNKRIPASTFKNALFHFNTHNSYLFRFYCKKNLLEMYNGYDNKTNNLQCI